MPTEIKDMEGLNKHADDVVQKLDAQQVIIDAMVEAKTAADVLIEELKSQNEEFTSQNVQFTEKLKSIQALIKTKDAILEENTPESHAYKIGKMTQLMRRNHYSIKNGQKNDGAAMLNLGAIPTMNADTQDREPIQIMKGFEERWLKTFDKASITYTPLATDESTL